VTARIPTAEGTFQLSHYVDARDGKEHLALVMGEIQEQPKVLVRVHSECFTGDVLGSQRCDCGEQLHQAMRVIAQEGQGVILYLRQEGRGIGLEQKLKAYNLQDQGYDTVDANLMLGHQADEREYSAAAAILVDLGVASIRLMTNNPAKIDHLEQLGVKIEERLPLASTVTQDNAAYLATKIQRMRHLLTLPLYTNGHSHAHEDNKSAVADQLSTLQFLAHDYHAQQGKPYVTLTYAQTLDGTIGAAHGGQLHISGPESLVVTHRLRAHHDAILIGIGTLLGDNPQLTVRLVEGPNPQPIIVDSHLRTPLDARIWSHPKAPWIATLNTESSIARALVERGARLIQLPANRDGQVDLAALFAHLGTVGIRSVMVEGGATIISSLIRQQLAHYAIVTVAPRFQAGIRVYSPSRAAIATLQAPSYTQAGNDIIVWGEVDWSHPVAESPHSNGILQSDFVPISPTPTVSSAL
jgi:3,4-dihydroxy 2-butanone 4-phosphate synthase/GTP cyclohydrolase II